MRILTCVALLALQLPSVAAAETIRDSSLGFVVEFPGDAEEEDLEMPASVKNAVAYELRSSGGYMIAGAAQLLPDNQRFTDINEAIEFVDPVSSSDEIVERRSWPVPGGIGYEVLTVRHEPMAGKYYDLHRFGASGNKVYQARGTYMEGEDPTQVRRFIRSFTVTR